MTLPDVPSEARAKFFRGLADPARLGILELLRDGPLAAGELATMCGLTASNASNHLQCLLECGLVKVEPRGRHNVYRLASPQLVSFMEAADRVLTTGVADLITACQNYGAPSRRALRPKAESRKGAAVNAG